MTKQPNINSFWSSLIIEELVRNGVEYFFLAPGSRSGPLAIAAARNKRAKTFVHFDERGLAFQALGYVSAAGLPAALICTSGTATANFFPAIVEASKKKLPLIVLTADRPPELQKTGANQTIEQSGIFSKYAKWQFDFPCPTLDIKPEFVLTTIDQAVYQAKSGTPGVVHLNCMFREPLVPIKTHEKGLGFRFKGEGPYTIYETLSPARYTLNTDTLKTINSIKSGLIVVGKLHSSAEAEAVLRLAQKLQFPIFPDVTSGLRLGKDHSNIIHYYDLLLAENKIQKRFKFDGIIHLGGRITSKRYYDFVAAIKPRNYVTVLAHPLRNDPLHSVTLRVQARVGDFCEALIAKIPQRKRSIQLTALKNLSIKAGKSLEQKFAKEKTLSEEAVARLMTRLLPKDSALFLASSLPIRHVDTFGAHDGNLVIIGSNRGASGIDGTIASAVGFSLGLNKPNGPNRPVTLLIGDLAFLHDLNSLAMLKDLKVPLTIVVLNNNGGGIFSKLPIAQFKDVFEKYFQTPHNLNLQKTGEMFGLDYSSPKSAADFRQAFVATKKTGRPRIIEVS